MKVAQSCPTLCGPMTCLKINKSKNKKLTTTTTTTKNAIKSKKGRKCKYLTNIKKYMKAFKNREEKF